MSCRVIISGMGALSCAGGDIASHAATFVAGQCRLSPIGDARVSHLKARYAGLIADFSRSQRGVPSDLDPCDRHVALAWVAASEALRDARVRPDSLGPRMGLIFSTCSGPMLRIEEHYERSIAGKPGLSARELLEKRYYSGAQSLARALGIEGVTTTVVTACSASTAATAMAADLVRCGMVEVVLAGGADAFSTSTLAGFDGLKATTDGKCAPFSKPYGLNLGEAAAFVVVESEESAVRRGGRVYAEILGSGMSNDAYHCSAPEPTGRGLALSIQRALSDAGLEAAQIGYVNAHGTGTEANDKAETRALRKVFGPRAEQVPVSSTKSMVGHCLGAAGAIETIASVLCAKAGVFPPTVNFSEPREGCNLDYVPAPGRPWPSPRVFLSNNLAFGGHNASLVISVGGEPAGKAERGPAEPIYITGCGLVSCGGVGPESLAERQERLQTVSIPGLPPLRSGFVPDEAISRYDRRLDLRQMDRASRWATVAARAAMRHAGFSDGPSVLSELGLYLALSAGPSWAESEFLTSFLTNHRQVGQLVAFPYIVPSSVAGNACRALRLAGHNLTLSCGPGAGLLAMAPAMAAMRAGHTQAMLLGAVDELSDRILSDEWMSGGLGDGAGPPGEGAAILALETEEHLRQRGGKPLARILGVATRSAARGEPGEVLRELVREVLSGNQVQPEQLTAVCTDLERAVIDRALDGGTGRAAVEVWDTSESTGKLEGSGALFALGQALASGKGRGGYLMGVSSSAASGHAVVLVETEISIKEDRSQGTGGKYKG